jgi:DNA-binding response OmpR family regulator
MHSTQDYDMALTSGMEIEAPDVYDDGCLRVEHNKFYAACAGQPLHNLRRKEFLILSRLVREIGRSVPQYALWAAAWGEDAEFDESASNSLKAHICYLRRKLEPFGLQILTRPNIGYMLSTADCVCQTTDRQSPAG